MHPREQALMRFGTTQHGLATRLQLRESEWSVSQIDRAVGRGRLTVVFDGVYRIAGTPITSHQQILAACLSTRGAGSHRAAAMVWGADLGPTPPLEVIVRRDRNPRPKGVTVHRTASLDPRDVVRRYGIPVTNPLRTVVDLGAVASPEQVASALDSFTSRKLITVAGARAYREKLAGKGQRGVGVLGDVLDHRALGDQAGESVLEPEMAEFCRRVALPMPAFQVRVLIAGKWRRMDFAYALEMIDLEVDGYEHHGGNYERWEDDLDRDAALTAAGWLVLRTSKATLRKRPGVLAANIRATLDRRRRSCGAA